MIRKERKSFLYIYLDARLKKIFSFIFKTKLVLLCLYKASYATMHLTQTYEKLSYFSVNLSFKTDLMHPTVNVQKIVRISNVINSVTVEISFKWCQYLYKSIGKWTNIFVKHICIWKNNWMEWYSCFFLILHLNVLINWLCHKHKGLLYSKIEMHNKKYINKSSRTIER